LDERPGEPARPSTRVVQISDLHLGAATDQPRQASALSAFRALSARLSGMDLDLLIATGDLVVDHPDHARDHRFARRALATLNVPVRTVPGNHDVGDHRSRAGLPPDWHGVPVTSRRIRAWRDRWGTPYWRHDLPGWTLFGLNSQVMGSGLGEEADQWAWLRRELRGLRLSRPRLAVAVFMHEGILAPHLDAPRDAWMNVPTDAAMLFLDTFAAVDLRLVASGHTHRYACEHRDGIWHVTAPSLTGPIPLRPDMLQAAGRREPGVLAYTFEPERFSVEFLTASSGARG
jgi:3',5'-cyclic AMP phosphodiesterase CpdA